MLGIVLVVEATIRVQHRISGHVVSVINSRLEIGTYDIHCDSPVQLSNEPWIHRAISFKVSVISGTINTSAPFRWASFEAAHIFPPGSENLWIDWDYGQYITDMDDTVGVSKINSQHIHGLFDQYPLSVNPDDNYHVTVFDNDMYGLDGRTLDPVCRDPADRQRVSDQLLLWHFRRSVLANMRGPGEPVFEYDFPPGTDMMGEIQRGPYAKERLGLEVAVRLRGSA
ncbi:hypothetical protein HOY82DRAFT_580131 [Tuber indicum]|nr:hypothetical protein HOY82DRAFT_580131 [Tuber indicum]